MAWLASECDRLGVTVETGATEPAGARNGSSRGAVHRRAVPVTRRAYDIAPDAVVLDVVDVRRGAAPLPDDGAIVVFDLIGGPIAVACG